MDVRAETSALSCHGILAEPTALRALRHRLLAWTLESGVPEERAHDIVLAGYEALANVADHAYSGGEPGLVDLDAVCHPDRVEVVIADHGQWRAPTVEDDPVALRGRGLLLLQATADHAEVSTDESGTVVTLGWKLD
ncbi:ATP-binding protein [Amycolatopsis benzoatilytica]|uniref:ATP-binding protein n=1 Tax=Amycolatopsis benzoatilytica TaxID=346045 RepID=UPI0003642E95|nr:ATP-binding protein [Amycolatopsis benzoatilytica]